MNMCKMLQIRNVPESLHRTLKARAARAGMSLSDYLLRELRHVASRPELDELLERIEQRGPARVSVPPSEVVRLERDRKP